MRAGKGSGLGAETTGMELLMRGAEDAWGAVPCCLGKCAVGKCARASRTMDRLFRSFPVPKARARGAGPCKIQILSVALQKPPRARGWGYSEPCDGHVSAVVTRERGGLSAGAVSGGAAGSVVTRPRARDLSVRRPICCGGCARAGLSDPSPWRYRDAAARAGLRLGNGGASCTAARAGLSCAAARSECWGSRVYARGAKATGLG